MDSKLGFASLVTIGIMFGFVFAILMGIAIVEGGISVTVAVVLTILVNVILFFISPTIQDFMFKWLYHAQFFTLDEFSDKKIASFIRQISQQYGFKPPRILLIKDDNPTAFTYGSTPSRARLAISEGLYRYLNEDEILAVVGHEMGHIRNKDFIIMTVAATIVQVLYELYSYAIRTARQTNSDDKENKGQLLYAIAALSYVFYVISQYILYYLSRLREYYADEFSAMHTSANALAMALIKIAYGISDKPESAEQLRLMKSTETLGIMSLREANKSRYLYDALERDPTALNKLFAFDLASPWAAIGELLSTHPLTAKRVRRLMELAIQKGESPKIRVEYPHVDHHKLYSNFALDLLIAYPSLPTLMLIIVLSAISPAVAVKLSLLVYLGLKIVQLFYKWPETQPEPATVLDLLADVYASPVRGRRVLLTGEVIGRGNPGYKFGEDVIIEDNTGRMFINYNSWIPWIGNFLFALTWVDKLVGKKLDVDGWFFRSTFMWMDAARVGDHGSHPKLSSAINTMILAIFVLLIVLA